MGLHHACTAQQGTQRRDRSLRRLSYMIGSSYISHVNPDELLAQKDAGHAEKVSNPVSE